MKNIKKLQQLPSQQLLKEIQKFILERNNHKKEAKKGIHYCLFLLCWKVGLRITEAIELDIELHHPEEEYKDLYLLRGKRKKERYVYISQEIINILKNNNWQPKKTSRRNFWEFLNRVRFDLNINNNIEIAPHTLRRCFATYNLLAGMPLNILQKILGHSRVSTTALYIKDGDIVNLLKFKPIN